MPEKAARFNNLLPGDRVIITNKEFRKWNPTPATVIRLGVRFPTSEPPIKQFTIQVRLDKHPFSVIIFGEPIRDLSFGVGDPNFELEPLAEEENAN